TSEVSGSPDVQRPLRFSAQQIDSWLSIKPLRFQASPRKEAAEVALAEYEVVLFHFVDQLTTGFAQSKRCPPILNRLEAGSEALCRTIEVGCFHGITENLVKRRVGKLIFREPP